MKKYFKNYFELNRSIKTVLFAEFFLQLVNLSYLTLLNFYLIDNNFSDVQVADILSYQYIATMIIVVPIGFLLPRFRLKKIFRLSGMIIPISSIIIIYSVEHNLDILLKASIALGGCGFTIFQVLIIPLIMRIERKEYRTQAITIHFINIAVGHLLIGIVCFLGESFFSDSLRPYHYLIFFTLLSSIGTFILFKETSKSEDNQPNRVKVALLQTSDILQVAKVLFPTIFISLGTGLSIPFMNLFFLHYFSVDYDSFVILSSISTIFMISTTTLVPRLKEKYGFSRTFFFSQWLGIAFFATMLYLVSLAKLEIIFLITCFLYVIRQCTINIGVPVISEYTMEYVDEHLREITIAARQAIWWGGFFISAKVFSYLRASRFEYQSIFAVALFLSAFGILFYHLILSRGKVDVTSTIPQ